MAPSRPADPPPEHDGERRREADRVRFESGRTESGQFLHRAVKFIFELARPRRRPKSRR